MTDGETVAGICDIARIHLEAERRIVPENVDGKRLTVLVEAREPGPDETLPRT